MARAVKRGSKGSPKVTIDDVVELLRMVESQVVEVRLALMRLHPKLQIPAEPKAVIIGGGPRVSPECKNPPTGACGRAAKRMTLDRIASRRVLRKKP